MKIDYLCPNEECGHEIEVDYSPAKPATGHYGPIEGYDPGEDAEIDPGECPHCGMDIEVEDVADTAAAECEIESEDEWECER
jgi:hypothetical protein